MINPDADMDAELENRIDAAALQLLTAKTPEARRAAVALLGELVGMRSAERVQEMEVERGLSR